ESPEACNARRVDNDVDFDPSRLGNDVIYCIFFGQICGPAKGVDAVVADEFIDKRLQNLLPAGNEDDIMTKLCQVARHCVTDALTCAGNKRVGVFSGGGKCHGGWKSFHSRQKYSVLVSVLVLALKSTAPVVYPSSSTALNAYRP